MFLLHRLSFSLQELTIHDFLKKSDGGHYEFKYNPIEEAFHLC